MTGLGNEVQIRAIVEQVVVAAIEKYAQTHPEKPAPEWPAPIKWAAIIISSVMTVGISSFCIWGVVTLSSLQQSVTRIETRQQVTDGSLDWRFKEIEKRLDRLEQARKGLPEGTLQ